MKNRWSVALLAAALLATAAPAEAGQGRIASKVEIVRGPDGVQFREQHTVSKGLRSRLSFGLLGRQMKISSEQGAGRVSTDLQRGREHLTRETIAGGGESLGETKFTKKGLLTRKVRTRLSREDHVDAAAVTATTHENRWFGGSEAKRITRTTGLEGNTAVTTEKLGRKGDVKQTKQAVAGDRSRVAQGDFKGERRIERGRDGIETVDTVTKRWGLLAKLSFGHLGNKKVTVEQRQSASGTQLTITTPKQRITRDTRIADGQTESFGTTARKGRVQSRDHVTLDGERAIHTTEHLRRNGTVKQVVQREVLAGGGERTRTQNLRRDGTLASESWKARSPNAAGKRDSGSGYRRVNRDGRTTFELGRGKVDGKRTFKLEVRGHGLRTKLRAAWSAVRGQVVAR